MWRAGACVRLYVFFFFLMIRRPPRSTLSSSSAASDVYKRQYQRRVRGNEEIRDGQAMSGRHVQAVVRVRPLLPHEANRGDQVLVDTLDDGCTVQIYEDATQTEARRNTIHSKFHATEQALRADHRTSMRFDACFSSQASTDQVFREGGVQAIVQSVCEGYAATVFAYGQTGAGKTHSMLGNDSEQLRSARSGIIALAADELINFTAGQEGSSVYLTFCEIYAERVYDLLDACSPPAPLKVRSGAANSFYVEGLAERPTASVSAVMSLVDSGLQNARVGSHALNSESNRSHRILTLHVHTQDDTGAARYGKLVLVDLAGSEDVRVTGSSGVMLKEASNINKSLFTLGKVISTMARKAQKRGGGSNIVPYRDSMLTKLLADSLGGASMCLILACVSPSSRHNEETQRTLGFACRARSIKNEPVVVMDPQDKLIADLKAEIQMLRTENATLKRTPQAAPAPVLPAASLSHSISVSTQFQRELEEERQRHLDLQSALFQPKMSHPKLTQSFHMESEEPTDVEQHHAQHSPVQHTLPSYAPTVPHSRASQHSTAGSTQSTQHTMPAYAPTAPAHHREEGHTMNNRPAPVLTSKQPHASTGFGPDSSLLRDFDMGAYTLDYTNLPSGAQESPTRPLSPFSALQQLTSPVRPAAQKTNPMLARQRRTLPSSAPEQSPYGLNGKGKKPARRSASGKGTKTRATSARRTRKRCQSQNQSQPQNQPSEWARAMVSNVASGWSQKKQPTDHVALDASGGGNAKAFDDWESRMLSNWENAYKEVLDDFNHEANKGSGRRKPPVKPLKGAREPKGRYNEAAKGVGSGWNSSVDLGRFNTPDKGTAGMDPSAQLRQMNKQILLKQLEHQRNLEERKREKASQGSLWQR
eukprot:TRINITY_DN2649_c0_g1_i7.p1 TRINITY_DN2649_c0_g1~~TRINITY_DN2649_c0_g1_i7.p1  ORF type:complete len:875 (-),score=200.16 TRINITY_DN2649_c0_g1_i7:159-2783(-)